MELVEITYRFADGHVEELEVEQEVAETLKELDRQEYNSNHRETRRHVTFDTNDEKTWLAVEDQQLSILLGGLSDDQRLYAAISTLNPKQKEMVRDLFFRHHTQAEYASNHAVSQQAVSAQLNTIIKKLKKHF